MRNVHRCTAATGLLLLAGTLAAQEAQTQAAPPAAAASNAKIGLDFEAGYSIKDRVDFNETKDSKSESGFDVTNADLYFKFDADRTKVLVRADLLNSAVISTALERAWAQYTFNEFVALKVGKEETFNFDPVTTTERAPYEIITTKEVPMAEITGGLTDLKLTYGLQLWEDREPNPATEGANREKVSDQDTGLGSNMALHLDYKLNEAINFGFIYFMDKGYDTYTASVKTGEVKDSTAYQLYGQYVVEQFGAAVSYAQQAVNSDLKGGQSLLISGDYYGLNPIGLHAFFNNYTIVYPKGMDPKPKAGNTLAIMADYKMNDNLKYFAQLQNFGKDFYQTPESANNLEVGLQANF
jgi:hypothetical protein